MSAAVKSFDELLRAFGNAAHATTDSHITPLRETREACLAHVAKLETIARFVRTWCGHSRNCAAGSTDGAKCNCGFKQIKTDIDALLGPDPADAIRAPQLRRPVGRRSPSLTP